MANLILSFLGPFQVTLDKDPITYFHSAKTQGLLVFLVLNSDRPQPREVLAAMFWPEETETHARNNLRQSIFNLRKLLGDSEREEQPQPA